MSQEIPGIPGPSYLPGETQAPAKEKQLGRNSIGVPYEEALLACYIGEFPVHPFQAIPPYM